MSRARWFAGASALLVLLLAGRAAQATVAGTRPQPVASFEVFGDALAVGNTLMVPTDPNDEEVNNHLLDSSEAFVSGFPCDGVLEGAFLFWTGSILVGTDDTADFTLADGTYVNDVIADQCRTVPSMGGFYYCRADVTDLVQGHTAGCGYNGMYVVGGVDAMEGDYNSSDPGNGTCFAQGKYAAWSLVLVYSEPEGITRRDVVLYDGFLQLDEDSYNPSCGMSNPTPGVDSFTIGGFEVGSPARGHLTIFGLEGDNQLGVPPQTSCTTCYDYLQLNGTKLYDSVMYPNNLFNGSTSVTGVDIDRFDIGETGFNLIQPGHTVAQIEVGSGDGCVSWSDPNCPPETQGGGESFFLGWMVMSLDTLSPLFIQDNTRIWFEESTAGAGETVWMDIRVQNDGNNDANDVRVWNTLPEGLGYVPGTTSVDGTPVADVGGTSPLYTAAGLDLGRIRWDYDREREIRFQVRVDDDQTNGAVLCSTATIDCTEIEPFETAPTNPCLTIEAPSVVDPPLLSVQDINGGFVEPGDVLRYRATLTNDGDRDAGALRFQLDLPTYVRDLIVVSVPSGAQDHSTSSRVDIRTIEIPAEFSVEVLFEVTIFTEAELLAAGVPSTGIDGLEIGTQGTLTAPYLPHDYLTDDPATGASPDPTVVVLTYRPVLEGTSKSGVDVDGGRTEPGDVLRYTIEIHNAGNRPATVDVTDDLPAGVINCAVVSGPPGTSCVAPPAGANGTGQVVASGVAVPPGGGLVTIVFEVQVAPDAADGLEILNTALVEVAEDPDESRTVTAPAFTVYNRPDFAVAEKSVTDGNGPPWEPGDPVGYTLRFVNGGNRAATDVVVSDAIDPGLTNVVAGQGGVVAGGGVTWTLPRIEPGEEVVLTFTAAIVTPLADGTVIANQGLLDAEELASPVATNEVQFTITSAPVLSTTTKSVTTQDLDGDGQVSPGDRVDYTIVVRNTGNAVATGTVVTDTVDPAIEDVTVGQGGQLSGGVITWNPGEVGLSPGGDVTLTFSALIVIPLADGTLISNQAFVTADGLAGPVPSDDPSTPAPDDPTVLVVHSQAVVEAAKSVDDPNGGDPMPGDTLIWQITVTNTGNAPAVDLAVTDTFPAELVDLVPGQGGQLNGSTIGWNAATTPQLASVVPGQPVTLTVTSALVVPLANGTEVCNTAVVQGPDLPAPVTTPPACVTVRSYPILSESTKTVADLDGNGHFRPGERVAYEVRIRNTGTETVTSVQVSDQIDPNLHNVTVGQGGSLAGTTIGWPVIASLSPGEERLLTFEADIVLPLADGVLVSNQAMMVSTEVPGPTGTDDPSTPAPGDPTVFVVESAPDLATATKTVEDLTGDPAVVEPGDTLLYTLQVQNSGTAVAQQVTVTDAVDSHLENVAPGQGGQFDGNTIQWNPSTTPALASLSPLDPAVSLTFTARVVVPTANGTVIENQGFIRHQDDPAPVPTDDPRTAAPDDPTRLTVISASNLTGSTKVAFDADGNGLAPGAEVVPGQLVAYSLTLSNTGNDAARAVQVRDPLDPALEIVSIGQGGRLVAGEVRWNPTTTPDLARIDPGQEVTLDFSARLKIPLDDGTLVSNQGWIRAEDMAQETPTDDPRTPSLDDPVELLVRSAPDLSASTKTVEDLDGGDFTPGDVVRYRILVKNTGDALAREVVVTDPVDVASLEDIQPGQGGTFTGSTIVWDAAGTPDLAAVGLSPQGNVELSFTARLKVPLDDGTLVSNQALLQAAGMTGPVLSDDPSTADLDDPTSFEVRAAPDLSALAKTVTDQNGGDPGPGDLLRYAIMVTNEGTMAARQVVVSDAVDMANLIEVVPADGGALAGGNITWDAAGNPALAAVAPGDTVTLRFDARIRPLTPGSTRIDNQAFARSQSITDPVPSDDPVTADPDDPTSLVVVASPDFSASHKGVGDLNGAPLLPGEQLSYTLVIRNTGNTYGTNIVVRDPIDPHLVDVQPGQGGRIENGAIVWNQAAMPALSRMDPGDEVILGFQARVAPDTPDNTWIRNQGQVVADEIEGPQPTDNPDTPEPSDSTDILVQTPDLSGVTKVVADTGDAPYEPGDEILYTITVPNTGSLLATELEISDRVDAANLVEIRPQDGGSLAGDTITWTPGNLPAGSQIQLRFRARIRPMTAGGTRVDNQAVVTAAELAAPVHSDDPATADPSDPTSFVVTAAPVLSAGTKEVFDLDGGVVQPGDALRYVITVKNTGNTWADDVTVTDEVDTRYLEDIRPEQGGQLDGDTIRWDPASTPALARVGLSPDADVQLAFTARVRQEVANATQVSNQAFFTCDQLPAPLPSDDPSTPDVDDPTRVTVVAAPLFTSSHKQVEDLDGGLVEPGDVLRYTVAVINNGTEPSSGTIVRDSIPARTSYVPGSTTLNGSTVQDDAGGTSPLVAGMQVRSARAGTPEGVVLVDDGSGASDALAVIGFRVRVEASAASCGATVANKAWIHSDRTDPVATNVAEVTVGDCPNLNATVKTWYLVEDHGTQAVVEPGDAVAYQIRIENTGPTRATGVVFGDRVPEHTSYLAGTLILDGAALTDAADTDAGEVTGGNVSVRVGTIESGAAAVIGFQVRVEEGPRVVNQGMVSSDQLPVEPTDDDGDETNGDNPTVIPVGDEPGPDLATSRKAVEDTNGGTVLPGDVLRYSVRVVNTGLDDARAIRVTDVVPQHTVYLEGSLERDGRGLSDADDTDEASFAPGSGTVLFEIDLLPAGSETELAFRARVGPDTELGTMIDNLARVAAAGIDPFDTNRVRVVVGGGAGTGGIRGRVFIEMGTRNGRFDQGLDEVLDGFQLVLRAEAAAGDGPVVATSISDEEGRFYLMDVDPGAYRLTAFSSTGVAFAAAVFSGDGAVAPGEVTERDLPVDPSGRVYDGRSGALLAGSVVSMFYDPEDPLAPGQKVPADELPFASQQDQVTDHHGMYAFDLPAGRRYQVVVTPPSPSWVFPSTTLPAREGFAAELLEGGRVVEEDLPDPAGDTRYFLRFDLQDAGDEVHNNHIPLDRLDGLLKLSKRVNKRVASVGDILTYTVTLQNGSGQDVDSDFNTNGLWIHDRTPAGFAYLDGSARVEMLAPDNTRRSLGQTNTPGGDRARGRLLTFGPYPVPAGHTLRVRYQLALGSDVEVGDHDNRARAYLAGNVPASNQAQATVRVIHDPVFDEALVIGKVFCDRDGDSFQNAAITGEQGVPGARVYLDTGWYAETDAYGKYHLKGIAPGLHLVKIDVNTLPPGSEVPGGAARALHLTRGLPAKLDFAVRCRQRIVTADPAPALEGPEPRTALLSGDLEDFSLAFQQRPVELPDLALWVGEPGARGSIVTFGIERGLPDEPVRFGVEASDPDAIDRWNLEILGPNGQPVDQLSGNGSPGDSITWEPQDPLPGRGSYRGVLHLALSDGTRMTSAPAAFGLGIDASGVDLPIFPARLAVGGRELQVGSASAFNYHVPVLADGAVEIEITRANGPTVYARLLAAEPPGKRSLAIRGNVTANSIEVDSQALPVPLATLDCVLQGESLERELAPGAGRLVEPLVFEVRGDAAGVTRWELVIQDASGRPVDRVVGTGPPGSNIAWDAGGAALSEGWYRYRLRAEGPGSARAATPVRVFALSGGTQRRVLSPDDLFRGRTAVATGLLEKTIAELAGQLGREPHSRLRVELHSDDRGGPVRAMARTRSWAKTIRWLLQKNGAPTDAVVIEPLGSEQPEVPNLNNRNRATNRRIVFELAGGKTPGDMPLVRPTMKLALDGRPLQAGGGGSFQAEVERLPGERMEIVWDDPDGRRLTVPFEAPGPGPAPVAPAARSPVHLRVTLPPEGAMVRSESLWVHGTTDPGARVTVNGNEATVDTHGRFGLRLPVDADTREITVVAANRNGQRASVRSPIEVAPHVWFLMAMADTAVAELEAGRHLEGVTKRTSTTFEDQVLVHGRAVLYLKARIKGKYLFDKYNITAHFDTAKGDEEAFFSQVIDPERYYPVYGDSGSEVQDVQARRKLYLLVQADESLLKVGNFRTKLEGIDVLRYDRTFYGGQLVFKKVLADDFDTDVRAHLADGHQQIRHAHAELVPTGGSLYYLPHTFLLEGSEQVRLVARDRESGMIIMQIPKQRDVDYTIRYREGRIIFHGPVSSTLDGAGMTLSSNTALAAEGHPVTIEVDYEYEGGRGPGEMSWAIQAHESWRDTVRVGGTYIQEGRAGDDFTLWGVDLSLQDPDNRQTYLKAEFARSENTDADNFFSPDGGLSFTALGADRPAELGRPTSGNAWKVRAGSELGSYLGYDRPLLNLSGYFQDLEPGFFSNGMITEQGQRKFGGRISWHPTADGILDLRHDGGVSSLYLAGMERTLNRQVSRLGYSHQIDRLELSGEYMHAASQNGSLGDTWSHADAVGAAAKVRFTKRWEGFVRQEAILRGDGLMVEGFGDRMKTAVGIGYHITKDLKLELTEAVRWSGDNATVLGFSTRLGEKARIYANERFNYLGGRYVSTTVVGAEDEPLDGVKTYGEYQLNGASAGTTNRAVLGLNNHFKWGDGWSADLHYERTQVFGDGGYGPGMALPGGAGSAQLPDAIEGGTGFEGVPRTAMPGMNAYGSMLAGDASRDAVGAGLEWKGIENLKLSLKIQFRYDDADDDLITAGNGGTGSGGLTGATPYIKDRLQFLGMAAVSWKWTEDLSFALHLNFADTEQLQTEKDGVVYVESGTEARLLEGSIGMAFRPVHYDWVALLGKYTVLVERRPVDLLAGLSEESHSHVFTVMPIFEIAPLRLQIVEKFAWKYVVERVEGLPQASGHTILWINRLNFHVIADLDIGGEYRILRSFLAGDLKHGFLAEVAYVLMDKVRIGAGYNFTSFSDTLLDRNDYDHGGFFFRVTGQY